MHQGSIKDIAARRDYQYDPNGNLKAIQDSRKGLREYVYDPMDRLIAEETGDHYRTYIYEPDTFKPLALVDGCGAEQASIYYYHLDHLGTPQELTNAQGDLVWSVTYRAYGNVVRALVNEIDNLIRFQGQYHDPETGLHYNRHRYYNPNTGRFLTPDPIGLAGGLNNYQYVPNPTGWVDPLGLTSQPKNGPESGGNGDSDGGVSGVRDEGPEVPRSEPVTNNADGPDFIVSRNGTATHASQSELKKSLQGAGAQSKGPTSQTSEVGEIFEMNTANGPMDIRIMAGKPDGGANSGPRTISTRPGTNDYVHPNGQRITGNASKADRRAIGHTHGQRP